MSSAAPSGHDRRRPRHAPDEGHLPEVLPAAEARQHLVPARHAHAPVEDDEHFVPAVPFADDDVAVFVVARFHRLHHAQELPLAELAEERHVRQRFALQGEGEALGARGVDGPLVPDADDDRGDVVFPSALVGVGDEPLGRLVAVEGGQERPELVRGVSR